MMKGVKGAYINMQFIFYNADCLRPVYFNCPVIITDRRLNLLI